MPMLPSLVSHRGRRRQRSRRRRTRRASCSEPGTHFSAARTCSGGNRSRPASRTACSTSGLGDSATSPSACACSLLLPCASTLWSAGLFGASSSSYQAQARHSPDSFCNSMASVCSLRQRCAVRGRLMTSVALQPMRHVHAGVLLRSSRQRKAWRTRSAGSQSQTGADSVILDPQASAPPTPA